MNFCPSCGQAVDELLVDRGTTLEYICPRCHRVLRRYIGGEFPAWVRWGMVLGLGLIAVGIGALLWPFHTVALIAVSAGAIIILAIFMALWTTGGL